MIRSISVSELLKRLNEITVIDLRTAQSYNNNHIPTAKNIPSELLISNPGKHLNKKETYYLYCQKGVTSIKICSLLNSLGYKAINLNGGYESWIMEK